MPLPVEASDQMLTIRYNRTHGSWVLVIGATMLFGLLLYDLMADGQRSLPLAIPYLLCSVMAYSGLTMLLRTAYFTYDPRTDRVESRDFGGRLRSFPGPGHVWLAYSTGPVEIREVAADHESRRVPISHLIADPEDWAEFIEHLPDLSAEEQ